MTFNEINIENRALYLCYKSLKKQGIQGLPAVNEGPDAFKSWLLSDAGNKQVVQSINT